MLSVKFALVEFLDDVVEVGVEGLMLIGITEGGGEEEEEGDEEEETENSCVEFDFGLADLLMLLFLLFLVAELALAGLLLLVF